MNKKAGYHPVAEQLSRPSNKHLAQGSLASSSSQEITKSPSSRLSHKANSNRTDHIQGVTKPGVKPKIICHSPQVVLSNIANSPSTKVERVTIDVPPTIFVTAADKSSSCGQGDSGIYKSGNIAGSPLDLSSTAKVVHVTSESFDLEPFPDADLQKTKIQKSSLKQHPVKGLSTEVSAAPTQSENPVKKRKKPPVKVVPSRYKTAAKKSDLTHNSSSVSSTAPRSKNVSASHKSRSAKPPATGKAHHIQATPKSKTRQEVIMEKASTPSAGFKTFFDSDMSHIAPYKQTDTRAPSPKPASSKLKVENEKVTQVGLDLAYSEYLRICYLNSAMKQAHNKRTRKAVADLSLLCTENAQLQKEVADLEEEVITLEHQEELESNLDAQISALGPAINKLPLTTDKYKELAMNVDATRHALPLNGVVVPNENQLESVLNRSKEILGELSTLVYTHVDDCAYTGEKCRNLDETIAKESSHLDDVETLAKIVTSLAVKSIKLRFQLESEENRIGIE